MISNAPLERLLSAVVALDGLAVGGGLESELRCLMRKIDWVATEAESAVKRCTPSAPAAPAAPTGLVDAA
jgi:hypothetical protein